MLPLRDHNPPGRLPFITWTLMVVNILVFASYVAILDQPKALAQFYQQWALVPANLLAGDNYHTLFSSMFLHGGYLHIAGNMLFLWIFGDNVEDAMGHVKFLFFYLLSGVGADGFHILFNHTSMVPTVGASGAIAGVMGAYMLLYPKAKVDYLVFLFVFIEVVTLPSFLILGGWMAMQLFSGVASTGVGSGVAYWAHIGGFIVGLVFTFPLWLKLGATKFWRRNDYHPIRSPSFRKRWY